MEIINCIDISKKSMVPMYQQIVDSITKNISNGNIALNQKLPSINMVSEDYYLSRDTVVKAYNILRDRKIIVSIPRRGNYIAKTQATDKLKILFLVNKLSSYKMEIYNSFLAKIGLHSNVDLIVYHCDEHLFLNTLKNKLEYDYYVILPHFKNDKLQHASFTDATSKAINDIPKDKLLVLDNLIPNLDNDIATVYQEFDDNIYEALNQGIERIAKYEKFVLVYPEKTLYPYPKSIINGFKKFCLENAKDFDVIDKVSEDLVIEKRDLYIIIEETDLVDLINKMRQKNFKLGKDIGVISYNDTVLKDLFGITVMSTDFKEMGELAAHMIMNNLNERIKVPFKFKARKSI
ncbi:GntR family transcriptional regulator [Flavobacterium faecale]|uniref:GntR family transcriptional regulator n=1 Tax=Flavobacterium faecale TaxID=1355330 RepID=UPI003AAE3A0B